MSTYQPIASITLASAASSVTFSGIPQTYTDLVLIISARGTTDDALNTYINFNGDSGSNYSRTQLYWDGSTAGSNRASSQTTIQLLSAARSGAASGTFGMGIINIQNYSNTTTFKTVLNRSGSYDSAENYAANVGLWRNTSAITQVALTLSAGSFASGSTFNLYGIANASITNVAKATGGDSVYTDGTYWYHIFRSSGTFTPTQALTADYLVVAGGGGGGVNNGGGGGAGGLRCTVTATGGGGSLESALSLTAQAYTVTVGAGGSGGAGGSPVRGTNGSNSVFSTITSTGGGGGGGGSQTGNSGGSGGGAGNSSTGGSGTANQGYAGGNATGSGSPNFSAAGGGGANAAAGNVTAGSDNPTNGGAGVATSITGSSVTYAGGGGGGSNAGTQSSGGAGGGGAGATSSPGANGTAGTQNTGGGGGGSGGPGAGGAGGSGIVIVRYAA